MRRLLALTALLALGICVMPTFASAGALDIPAVAPPQFRALLRAKLHMPPPRHGFESSFELKAQHGYTVTVTGEGDIVAVEVSRPFAAGKGDALEELLGSFKQSVTAYVARGTVTEHRIVASFGKFGKVDVRFRPTGQVVESGRRRGCRGADHFTSQLGVFVGGVSFRGEGRYVAVRSHRAKGSIRSPLHLHCGRSFQVISSSRARPVREQPSFVPTFLTATHRHAVSALELITLRVGKTTLFAAINEESLGSMARIRFALATAPSKKSFSFNEALTGATITPPMPFHGKGTYHAASDGTTTWAGSLSVSFPGAPRLPLTGEEFEPTLTAGF